ncbi:MAG TPA: 3-deoxy-7-phosphoheptulonate synthase, partial [Chthonomonadaceae bacterium]|nr:3-deoxy-7-phosphoheptulonate synthase [Chthonomonadaceae bacterium]
MMVLMHADATAEQIDEVMARIIAHKMKALRLPGGEHIAIGVASAIPPELREPLTQALSILPGVDHVVQISRPYKLASREFHRTDTVVRIKDVEIGGPQCVVMAGP